jgi:hypothetical protein
MKSLELKDKNATLGEVTNADLPASQGRVAPMYFPTFYLWLKMCHKSAWVFWCTAGKREWLKQTEHRKGDQVGRL